MATPVYQGDGLVPNGTLTAGALMDRSVTVDKVAQLGHPDQPDPKTVGTFAIHADCSAAAGTIAVIASTPFRMKIVDVIVQCIGAVALGTAQVAVGVNPVTDAIVCAVNKVVVRAGTIDAAYATVAAGSAINVVKHAAADQALVTIIAVKL